MSEVGRTQVGHPVDVGSGAVYSMMEDFVLLGTMDLAWLRYYSTDIDGSPWLGRGWALPWFMNLERVAEGYILIDERGRPLLFPVPAETDMQVADRLISYGANMELVRHRNYFAVEHWHYGTDDVESFCFPVTGAARMPLGWLENVYGHRVRVDYDDNGRPERVVQEIEQRTLELTFGPHGMLQSVAHVLDNGGRKLVAQYYHDGERRLTMAVDAMGHATSYRYDEHHRMVSETNALGSSFHFIYDENGRCVHTYGDGGYFERRLTYLPKIRTTRVIDSQGTLTSYILNAAGQVIQEVSPLGAATTTEFDEFGRCVSTRDPVGGTLRYEYDARGDRVGVEHEDGARTSMTYTDRHLLRTLTTPSGATWTYEFDARGWVTGIVDPLGHRRSVTRDDRGLVTETVMPSGFTVRRRYGPALRWVEAADDVSLITLTQYDESGNQTAISNPDGLLQRTTYDALGLPVLAEDRFGHAYRFSWNGLGELLEQSGPDVAWERRDYDGFGQLLQHVNPVGAIRVTYDNEGRIVRVVNRANEALTWTYNADGWLATQTDFDGRTERYEYDLAGRATLCVKPDGQTVAQKYNKCGAIVERGTSDGDVKTFAYDVDGHLVKAINNFCEVALERNPTGRVIAEAQNGRRIEHLYDADGDRQGRRIVGLDQPGLRFKRDARKRLTSLEDSLGVCLQLQWDDVNRLVERRFADTVTETLSYDPAGRLHDQTVEAPRRGEQVKRSYEYNSADSLILRDDNHDGPQRFEYDEIGRLVAALRKREVVERYEYDGKGAILRTHRGPRVVTGGQTLQEGDRRYTYGADGSVRAIDVAGQRTVLEYTTDGQVSRATLPDGTVATYEHDALGRRVAKSVNGTRTDFLWEGPVLAAEIKAGQPTKTHYFFSFEPLIQWSGRRRFLPIKDQAGTVREVFDERGALVWSGTFEAYGALRTESGNSRSAFRLRGQYADDETGLHYNFYRTYSPFLADYTSPDPIGLEGGMDFYAFPRNPLQWDDPFGLKCGTSACGEKSMDGFFGQKGYKKISARGKNPNANGIDAIYYKKGGKPPYIIAEAKNGGGYLHTDQHGNQQMSDKWINTAPGNSNPSKDRLERALPPGSPHLADMRTAATKGQVGSAVYHPDKDPKVTHYGLYDGKKSNDSSAPPVGSGPF